jgi:hypothetical protein
VQKAGRIRPRFGNQVFLIDTGMLSSYYPGGRPSALAICGGSKFIAVYLDQQTVLLDSTASSLPIEGRGEQQGASKGTAASEALVASPLDRICSATATTPQ